jgi:translocation and assembly module TamB
VTAAAGAEGVTADLGLVLVDVGRIDGHLELPDELATGSPSASRRVRGRLTATLSDVSFVQALVDGVTGVGGRLDADLTLSGTRGAPEVRGEAVLAYARADVPAIGLELRDLRLAARGVGREPVALDGSVRSGEGALTLTGSVPLAPSAETPARLTARGRDFEVVDTEEVHALASPDLTLVHDGALAEVTGEVRVPEARVEIAKRSEEGAVSVSDDVVFVGPDAAGEPRPGSAEVAGRVRVILGDDVEVDVLGLHAEPTGSLLIVEAPDRPTTATGELEVSEGTFQAYGQDLTIERGRLVFAGPVTDPGIDLRAFRRASDGVVAGLDATGTLRAPEVTLWSEPPMAQSEQLSYLLLGRPLDQASASDGDVLANAATSLGIKGGNLLGKRLAARYGLEEARIEGGSRDEASLVLGKYLSPRLLVGYGIGLFEAVNTFRIRYLLTDALALEAMTGEGTSADLLYTLERGEGAERDPPPGRPR